MSKKDKFYVVWEGFRPGIYYKWEDCKAAINGFSGAKYKSFDSFDVAKRAFNGDYEDYKGSKAIKIKLTEEQLNEFGEPDLFSIAVDAASSGNPGKMEYQGVDTQTKELLFHQGPFPEGTNNIGEFLALVHGLAYLKQKGSNRILYTDSRIAMSWVKQKKCNTNLKRSGKNAKMFALIERAINWLTKNSYTTKIVKWETKVWGEIPADFGRK